MSFRRPSIPGTYPSPASLNGLATAPESLTLETATKCAAAWTFSDNLGNLQVIANTPLGGVGYRESGNTAYGIGYLAQNGGKNVATYNSWWHATADRRQVHTLTARLMPGASNNTFLMDGVADPKAQSSNFWQGTAALAAVYRFFANSRADVTAHSVRLYARRLAERRVSCCGSGGRDPAHVRPAAGAVPRPSAGRDPRGRRPPAFRRRLLVQETSMTRTWHKPQKDARNPVMKPETDLEKGRLSGRGRPTEAMAAPFSGGVWYDGTDGLFKCWYCAGWFDGTGYAYSKDGFGWIRPELKAVPGTNRVVPPTVVDGTRSYRDSAALVMDPDETGGTR